METGPPRTRAPLRAEPLPVAFMNTVWADRDGVHDALADPAETLGWLRAVEDAPVRGAVSLGSALELGARVFDLRDTGEAEGVDASRAVVDVPGTVEATGITQGAETAGPSAGSALLDFTRRLVDLRDALRRLAADVTGDPRPAAQSAVRGHEQAVELVNRASSLVRAWPQVVWPSGGKPASRLRAGGEPADLVLAILAEEGVALFAGPDAPGLRACLAPGCVLYFTGANPRREWCSAACGNRARVARHYQRRHQRAEG